MEIKDVFISIVVALVGIVAILAWIAGLNLEYGTDLGADGFNATLQGVQTTGIGNVSAISRDVADNTQLPEGPGDYDDQSESLISQSRQTFTTTTKLLGLVPTMLREGANVLGIPETYQNLAVFAFLFVFALTIAYLLLLGVRSLIS